MDILDNGLPISLSKVRPQFRSHLLALNLAIEGRGMIVTAPSNFPTGREASKTDVQQFGVGRCEGPSRPVQQEVLVREPRHKGGPTFMVHGAPAAVGVEEGVGLGAKGLDEEVEVLHRVVPTRFEATRGLFGAVRGKGIATRGNVEEGLDGFGMAVPDFI